MPEETAEQTVATETVPATEAQTEGDVVTKPAAEVEGEGQVAAPTEAPIPAAEGEAAAEEQAQA